MKTLSLCTPILPGMNAEQNLKKKLARLGEEERQNLLRFLESMPSEHLDDPGNFLGFIHKNLNLAA